ncbi:MAG TPA: hypothetical protein GXZ65_02310 [Clostridiales bacterium]|jgi:hypothetical protein|nr:hypothetical protein [Clostridiales bacterium]
MDIIMNTGGEYGKYMVQDLKAPKFSPGFEEFYNTFARRVLWIDNNVVPGAFQFSSSWYLKASDVRPLHKHDEHYHDVDELIGFYGSNPDDPYDLGGVIEIGIGGEIHRITRSTLIFLPAGLKHLPLSIIELHRPIFHFSVVMAPFYSTTHTNTGETSLLNQPRDK